MIRNDLAWILIAVLSSAFISLFISFEAGMLALFFLAAAWWTWQYPENGFLFLLVILPTLPMLKITQTIGTTTLIKDVIILTLFMRLVARPLLTQRLPYQRNIFFWPIAALLLWTTISAIRSENIILGLLRARDIVLYIILYFAALYLPREGKIWRERFKWLIAALLIILALGVYQFFLAADSSVLRFDPVKNVWIPRISSVLAHPSIFGQYLLTFFTLILAAVLGVKEKQNKIILSSLLLIMLPFIWLTYSRAVWIGLTAGIITIIPFYILSLYGKQLNKLPWRGISAVGLFSFILLTWAVSNTSAVEYMRSYIDPTYGSNEERLEFLWRLIAPVSNYEAMVGKGLGDVLQQNFREADIQLYDIASGASRAVQLTKNQTLVDNQHLKTFIEMGLTGLLIYFWLYWIFIKSAWSLMRSRYEEQARDKITKSIISLWSAGFLAAFVAQALFIDIWDIVPTNVYFWIIAAFVSTAQMPITKLESSSKASI